MIMDQKYLYIGAVVVIIGGVIAITATQLFAPGRSTEKQPVPTDYKNAAYVIEGRRIELRDGVSEIESIPGSASKTITRYFGNELKTDLNYDGREDVVFLLTQQAGGSGTFYYIVAALNTDEGYVGSDGYLLGDRIAPQTIELSQNSNQEDIIVANFADRAPGEPMTAQPSVGKSVYLRLDLQTMQWVVVEPNFGSESKRVLKA